MGGASLAWCLVSRGMVFSGLKFRTWTDRLCVVRSTAEALRLMEAHVGDKKVKPKILVQILLLPPKTETELRGSFCMPASASLTTYLLQLARTSVEVATVLDAGIDISAENTVLNLALSRPIM